MSHTGTDGVGSVMVSLTVFSTTSIEDLNSYRRVSADGRHVYDLGTERIADGDAGRRAEKLDAAIEELLHRLDDVTSSALQDPATFVRLFLTFGGGSHTISPHVLRRVALVNATLWIDA